MTEFEKLTVAKLREELTKRGLPKTGLKAALIQRLNEADEQPTAEILPTEDSKPESPESNDLEEDAPRLAVAEEQHPVLDAPPDKEGGDKPTSPPAHDPPNADPIANSESWAEPTAIAAQLDGSQEDDSEVPAQANAADVPARIQEPLEAIPSEDVAQTERPLSSSPTLVVDPGKPAENGVAITLLREDSLNGEEALEDMKKRKRRSTTPPPSSASVAKKARLEDARPHVKLPEDTSMEEVDATPEPSAAAKEPPQVQQPTQTKDVVVTDASEHQKTKANGRTPPTETAAKDIPADTAAAKTLKEASPEPDKEPSQQAPEISEPTGPSTAPQESPAKRSPSDARFKNILPPVTRRNTSPAPTTDPLNRTVTPALHPATTALYIRNILRPLHVDNLRDHLLSLATPSSTSPDPTTIATFHLDSIRTHCLVRFSSVAAASRVRTGLHDRIWPDEKNRKPLWVDFVPEEKLEKWIEVENEGDKGGRAAAGRKRWEVVYENEEDGVKAYLQEVGSSTGGPRGGAHAPLPTVETGAGVKGAPSGPRVRESNPDRPQQQRPPMDKARGFQALDDLFRSTAAKPKLYYLPVPRRTADKRLDMLAEGRGGGR
ncbi:MAG: hypothetical protein Q9207_004270, partial [Kuettlingeria erythrocarpa]